MDNLKRYYLSLLILFSVFSCSHEDGYMTPDERRANAEKIYSHAIKHPQGSPKCMELIQKAIQMDTTYAEAIRELSVAYLKRGMPHKWKPLIDKAVYHDQKTWQPVRGTAYLKVYRDYKKAISDFDAMDSLTPNHVDFTGGHSLDYWRGIAYLGLNDYENCIYYFDKHIKMETEDTGEDWVEINAFLYRGIAKMESGNLNEAMDDFNKIVYYFKQSADAKYQMAKILAELDQKDSARVLLKEAKQDFRLGFYNNSHYVEAVKQIYWEDLELLSDSIKG